MEFKAFAVIDTNVLILCYPKLNSNKQTIYNTLWS